MSEMPQYLPPRTRVGPYEVIWLLGTGGYGAVYKVVSEGAVYALKLSNHDASELSDEARHTLEHRTLREYDVLARLQHPNLVRVHRFGWWPRPGAFPFLVMDYIEGVAFNRWVARDRPSLGQVVGALSKVARALHALHQEGVCHRDLKSENLLVRPDGEPVLIDLGLAQVGNAPPLTGADAFIGTYKHWSPEYAAFVASEAHRRGERFPHGPAADLHALGYLLYEVLTGRPPFLSDDYDLFGLVQEIRDVVPPDPRRVNLRAPAALSALAMQLLDKDPARRPPTGEAVAQALEAGLLALDDTTRHLPLATPPPPPREGTPSEWPTRSTLTPDTYRRIMNLPASWASAARTPRASAGRAWVWAGVTLALALGVWAPMLRSDASPVEPTQLTAPRTPSTPPRVLTTFEKRQLGFPAKASHAKSPKGVVR